MKKDLKKLALLGIAGGVMFAQGPIHADNLHTLVQPGTLMAGGCGSSCHSTSGGTSGHQKSSRNIIAEADVNTNATTQLMTEDQLKSLLNEQGKQTYNSLDAEGKAQALKLASRSCKGTNDCKGQNSCKTENNSCAGKGNCAGTSACSFKDKNMAVKVAAQNQAAKRDQANSGLNR